MTAAELNKRIEEILKGIDKTELEDRDGWWETSSSAKFGKQKLEEVKKLIAENV